MGDLGEAGGGPNPDVCFHGVLLTARRSVTKKGLSPARALGRAASAAGVTRGSAGASSKAELVGCRDAWPKSPQPDPSLPQTGSGIRRETAGA